MNNKLFKKGLIISIIILLIAVGIKPSITAYNNIKFTDLNENDASKINEKPDLIITDVDVHQIPGDVSHSVKYEFFCKIKNIGDSDIVESTIWIEVNVFKAQIFKPDKFYGTYQSNYGHLTLEPSETSYQGFLSSYGCYFPVHFLKFECYFHCSLEEDTSNNYFNKTYFYYNNLLVWGLIPLPILF